MANLILDDAGRPMPQYMNSAGNYEAWKGANGAGKVAADDGAIATLGTTTDASTQNTVIGRLQQLISLQTANKFANLTMHASQAETVSGQTADVNVGNYQEGIFFLNVTAVSGTNSTLDIKIQTKDPVSGTYFVIASFTQVTAVTNQVITIPNCLGSIINASYTLGGMSPSFTFSLGGVVK
jgi:hypothetical protein